MSPTEIDVNEQEIIMEREYEYKAYHQPKLIPAKTYFKIIAKDMFNGMTKSEKKTMQKFFRKNRKKKLKKNRCK